MKRPETTVLILNSPGTYVTLRRDRMEITEHCPPIECIHMRLARELGEYFFHNISVLPICRTVTPVGSNLTKFSLELTLIEPNELARLIRRDELLTEIEKGWGERLEEGK